MHKRFDHQLIEKKWQEKWKTDGIYAVGERDEGREKEYVLVELPYPSGNLHIGHWYAFAVPDIYVRHRRMTGKQVVYPIGFDAFGLPAENAAIKRNLDPREWTEGNIEYMKGQLQSMGNAFSWDKTAATIDPSYYKWTQWMFTQFFESGLAYRGEAVVNWDPKDKTVIANEQVLPDGTSERSGVIVEKKRMPQWMLRITDFADELIDDLEPLEWPEHIKAAQRRWIGRSEGAEIDFALSNGTKTKVFTTRPDTLFGATYLVLAPELTLELTHEQASIKNWDEVVAYIEVATKKKEMDRLDATKEKTGVKLEGITATNPATGEEIPVYVADYVLAGYGTGAIMAVPAHDERDYEFAKKYGIEVREVVLEEVGKKAEGEVRRDGVMGIVLREDGKMLLQRNMLSMDYRLPGGGFDEGENDQECLLRELREESGYDDVEVVRYVGAVWVHFNARPSEQDRVRRSAVYEMKLHTENRVETAWEEDEKLEHFWVTPQEAILKLEENPEDYGELTLLRRYVAGVSVCYSGRGVLVNSGEFDGLDSEEAMKAITEKVGGRMTNTYRLRDWSIGRQRYWGVPIPIVYDPDGNAHVVPKEHLPWTLPSDVDFTPTGEPPLAKSAELKQRTEAIFGKGWTPEVETMDTFVDSSWYFLRYIDNHNDEEFCSVAAQESWLPVDLYFGGAEHTTMHLLYSRFWQKALKRLGLVAHAEPYRRRINRGLILGPDGNKMSKSKGNVIDPDEQVERVGADTVKMYLAFMGPYGEVTNYPWDMGGIAGLRRFLERVNGLSEHLVEQEPVAVARQLHKTIKKVSEDIPEFKFNTAISAMMIFVNVVEKEGLSHATYVQFLRLLAPFAPHLTEELWQAAGQAGSIHTAAWPAYDPDLATDREVTIGVQINGKMRGEITLAPEADEATARALVEADDTLAGKLAGVEVRKIIYVPGRIINLIVSPK